VTPAYRRLLIVTPRYPSVVLLAQDPASALDWFSAVTGATGTLGAIAAVIIAVWVARRDGRTQRAEQADRDAAQARLVSTELRYEDGRWWVRTTNDSAAPVFRCEAGVVHPRGRRQLEAVPGAPVELYKLGPDESRDRAVEGDGDLSDGVAVLTFIDAAGLRWLREGDFPPHRVI
jgi:catechol 2,3-dioxygenase-like lactoylglutathione lyase family enzyme